MSDGNDKKIFDHLMSTFGRAPKKEECDVHAYHDEAESESVRILRCSNVPLEGADTFATLTLSTHTLKDEEGEERDFGVELVAVAADFKEMANVLSTASFNIIKDGWLIEPYMIFPDLMAMYLPNGTMQHIMFIDPLGGVWEKDLESWHGGKMPVAFLQALPISESEYQYAVKHGQEELLDKIIAQEAEIYDVTRQAVV